MESFFVAGSAEDPTFAEAEQLGEFLIKCLPRICSTKDMQHPSEWPQEAHTCIFFVSFVQFVPSSRTKPAFWINTSKPIFE